MTLYVVTYGCPHSGGDQVAGVFEHKAEAEDYVRRLNARPPAAAYVCPFRAELHTRTLNTEHRVIAADWE